jgi:hypothetical protein
MDRTDPQNLKPVSATTTYQFFVETKTGNFATFIRAANPAEAWRKLTADFPLTADTKVSAQEELEHEPLREKV